MMNFGQDNSMQAFDFRDYYDDEDPYDNNGPGCGDEDGHEGHFDRQGSRRDVHRFLAGALCALILAIVSRLVWRGRSEPPKPTFVSTIHHYGPDQGDKGGTHYHIFDEDEPDRTTSHIDSCYDETCDWATLTATQHAPDEPGDDCQSESLVKSCGEPATPTETQAPCRIRAGNGGIAFCRERKYGVIGRNSTYPCDSAFPRSLEPLSILSPADADHPCDDKHGLLRSRRPLVQAAAATTAGHEDQSVGGRLALVNFQAAYEMPTEADRRRTLSGRGGIEKVLDQERYNDPCEWLCNIKYTFIEIEDHARVPTIRRSVSCQGRLTATTIMMYQRISLFFLILSDNEVHAPWRRREHHCTFSPQSTMSSVARTTCGGVVPAAKPCGLNGASSQRVRRAGLQQGSRGLDAARGPQCHHVAPPGDEAPAATRKPQHQTKLHAVNYAAICLFKMHENVLLAHRKLRCHS